VNDLAGAMRPPTALKGKKALKAAEEKHKLSENFKKSIKTGNNVWPLSPNMSVPSNTL
jgi:hypothetical protein